MKKQWISIKRGYIRDPKHRLAIGECTWLFQYMIDVADWETGKIHDWKDEAAADDMQMPIRTLREQRRKLESLDYISCSQRQYGQEIAIMNWTNPREYSGEVYNRRQGGSKPSPLEDVQGDTQGVTPTSSSNNQIPFGTDEPDLVDLELQKKAKQDGITPALIAFERDMHTPGNWTWYPSKTTQEPEWRALRDFVVKLHAEDPKCFKKYNEWRNRPYVKGAMSNKQIKNYPADFEASWTDYIASSAMYGTSDETSNRPERKIHRAQPEEGVIDFNEAKRRGLIPG